MVNKELMIGVCAVIAVILISGCGMEEGTLDCFKDIADQSCQNDGGEVRSYPKVLSSYTEIGFSCMDGKTREISNRKYFSALEKIRCEEASYKADTEFVSFGKKVRQKHEYDVECIDRFHEMNFNQVCIPRDEQITGMVEDKCYLIVTDGFDPRGVLPDDIGSYDKKMYENLLGDYAMMPIMVLDVSSDQVTGYGFGNEWKYYVRCGRP